MNNFWPYSQSPKESPELTLLIDRVKEGESGELATLLEEGKYKDEINEYFDRGYNEETLLHLAIRYCSTDCLIVLLDYGADIEGCNYYSETPLLYACQMKRPIMVRILVARGADVHARDCRGRTTLILSISTYEIFKLMATNGVDPSIFDEDGYSTFYYLMNETSDIFVEHVKLLAKLGEDFSKNHDQEWSPFMMALDACNETMIKCLILDIGVDPNTDNPLFSHVVFKFNPSEKLLNMIKLLIDLGSDPSIQNYSSSDFHYMNDKTAKLIKTYRPSLKTIAARMVRVHAKDITPFTPKFRH